MKKLVSFVLATVLCVGMTATVMAAPSAGTGTVSPDVDNTVVAPEAEKAPTIKADAAVSVDKVVDEVTGKEVPAVYVDGKLVTTAADGAEVFVKVEEVATAKASYTEAEKAALEEVEKMTEGQLLALFQSYVIEAAGKTIDSSAVIYKDVDSNVPGATITLTVEGVKAGNSYAVLHIKDDGSKESLPVVAKVDGKLEITFTTFSPIVITELLTVKTTVSEPETPSEPITPVTPSEPVSPKTADAGLVLAFAAIALVGVVLATRKVSVNR